MTQCNSRNCDCNSNSKKTGTMVINLEENLKFDTNKNRPEPNLSDAKVDTILLQGLDCVDCALKLEKKLSKMPGVKYINVNFSNSKMTVHHELKEEDIINAVEKSGYNAVSQGKSDFSHSNKFWRDKKTIFTAISGLFLIGGLIGILLSMSEQVVNRLFLVAILIGGFYVFKNALYSIKSAVLDMNVLLLVAVSGAIALGEWTEAAAVVFLFSVGNSLQAYSMEKTRGSIKALMDLAPAQALVKRKEQEIMMRVEDIIVGDTIIVKPGERIAMDGEVIKGESMVNQAPITGESMPIQKTPGSKVFAGTINEEGSLEIIVTRLVADNTLSRIIKMVEEAQAKKAPSQQFVDVFARYYTPAVIAIAVAIAFMPTVFLGLPFKPWFEKALILLVIACPCALVISTPVSIVSAIGSAARRGVLIKGGIYLEEAGKVKAVAFDKTGTITEGRLEVNDVIAVNGSKTEDVLSIAAAVENRSQHPLARAVVRYAERLGIEIIEGTQFQSFTGKGAGASLNEKMYYVGNKRLFEELEVNTGIVEKKLKEYERKGLTVMLVGSKNNVMGIITLADRPRKNGLKAVRGLRAAGINKILMLTGDNAGTARAIAFQTEMDEYKAELLPENKLEAIKELKARYGKVAMVGDGINDAPALAVADVGISLGGAGTDTALETANIVLMADDPGKIPYAMKLSRRALRIIKQNIVFALLLKAIFIAGTFIGFTNLWIAVFADTGAALIVIANGMRLMLVKESLELTKTMKKGTEHALCHEV